MNGWVEHAVVAVHRAMGFDPNDGRTTLGPFPAFHVGPFLLHEDFVGNPLHFVAALVAGVIVWRRRGASGAPARLWAALSVASALAFVVVLKWQPWNSRLHLPLFVLACPLIGLAFEAGVGSRRRGPRPSVCSPSRVSCSRGRARSSARAASSPCRG